MDIQLTKDCIKDSSHLGYTIYHNICTGAESSVPGGSVDWIGFAGISAMCILFFAFFAGMIAALIRDI